MGDRLGSDETAGEFMRRHADARRFVVMPYLQYGPNNQACSHDLPLSLLSGHACSGPGPRSQFLQLMEAAVVARSLGRSLVMPNFRAWLNDETGSRGTAQTFPDTFDVDAVNRFVPLSTASEAWVGRGRSHLVLSTNDMKQQRLADFLAAQRLPCCPQRRRLRGVGSIANAWQVQQLVRQAGVASAPVIGWHSFFSLERALLLEAARAFRRAPAVQHRARALASSLFGSRPFLAVHLRREKTELGCVRGRPSVLCPKTGPEWTLDTRQVVAAVRAAQQRFNVDHIYISTIWPAQHQQYDRELPHLLKELPGCADAPHGAPTRRAHAVRERSRAPWVAPRDDAPGFFPFRRSARSLSDLRAMEERLGVAVPADQPLTRYAQSLVEQELCTIAAGFLGSERSTWTGNVELQRAAFGRPSLMF